MGVEMLSKTLEDAIKSEFGLVLQTPQYSTALILRRKLYSYRERLRKQGNSQYDGLSFIPKKNGELWIVRRDNQSPVPVPEFTTRQLLKEEMPTTIAARGKRKLGLIALLELMQIGKKP